MKSSAHFQCTALAVVVSALASGTVIANESTSQNETITILGEAYRNTATKTVLEPKETPQGITIIDSEQIEQRGVKSLNQALRYAPGVVTESKGASVTMYDTFYIRGFASNESYYDGLKLPYLTGWNLQPQIDPIAMQQVEIFKGPTSVLYGSMPPGGMVNMIAKSPQEQANTQIGVSAGTKNLMEATLDSTGQIGDSNVNYRLIALARKRDSQVDHAEEERYVVAPSLDWQATENTLVNVSLYYQNDPSMGINSSLPASGMIVSNPAGSIAPTTSAGDVNWSTFEREVFMLGYKVNHVINDDWTILQNARYTDASLYQENTYHLATNFDQATGAMSRNIYDTDEDSQSFVIDNQLSGTVKFGSNEHNLLFGIDYLKLKGNSSYREYAGNAEFYAFNIFNPNNSLLDTSALTEVYDESHKIKTEQLGFYLQDQIRLGDWVLLAGGRYDLFEASDVKTSTIVAGTRDTADHNQFSYRVGALYEFSNGLSPFASYATSFEPTAGTDIDGKALKPQLGEQIEVGFKYQSLDSATELTASYFHITKEDAVSYDPNDPTYRAKIQLGEVRSQGLELEGRWFVTDAWDINASYSYMDMEITKDVDGALVGTTPIYVPEHSANLWTNYYLYNGPLAGARIGGGVRYVGEMQMDAYNVSGKVPSYTLVDLSLGYDLGLLSDTLDGATANLVVNNLFDEESYTCYDSMNCWYGSERSVEAKFKYNF